MLEYRRIAMLVFLAFAVASLFLYPFIGRVFFPTVDAGQLRLHVRWPPGTRIEQTEAYFQQVEDSIRTVIPAGELAVITDDIGLPNDINLALSDNVSVGPSDGEILVALQPTHGPTAEYLEALREQLPRQFPELEFSCWPRCKYRTGLTDYLLVIDAELTLLANQLSLAQTVNLQQAASIRLIRALGGGWEDHR